MADSDSDSDEMDVDDGIQKSSKGISEYDGLEYHSCFNIMHNSVNS